MNLSECQFKKAFYAELEKNCPAGKMVKVCCHCLKVMGYKKAAKECQGQVSHGVCGPCVKKFYAEYCEDVK